MLDETTIELQRLFDKLKKDGKIDKFIVLYALPNTDTDIYAITDAPDVDSMYTFLEGFSTTRDPSRTRTIEYRVNDDGIIVNVNPKDAPN